jgi:hypothetical protein
MATPAPDARCAVHPSSPSYDTCPVCGRARCDADAHLAPGGGCLACEGRPPTVGPPPLDLRSLVGAACLCGIVVVPAGLISSEYVGAGIVGYAVPMFVGILVSIAAEAGAGPRRGPRLRYLAILYSVLAIAIGLHDPRASGSVFVARNNVLPLPEVMQALLLYAVAAAAAWLWTAPPRVVRKKDQ